MPLPLAAHVTPAARYRDRDGQPIRAVCWLDAATLAAGTNSRSLLLLDAPASAAPRAAVAAAAGAGAGAGDSSVHALPELRVLRQWLGHHLGSVYALAASAGGRLLATCSNDTTLRLVHASASHDHGSGGGGALAQQAPRPPLVVHPRLATLRDVAFFGGGGGGEELLACAGGGDFAVAVFRVTTGGPGGEELAAELAGVGRGHTGTVHAIRALPAAPGDSEPALHRLVTASADGCVRLWHVAPGGHVRPAAACVRVPGGAGEELLSLAVVDAHTVLVGSARGMLHLIGLPHPPSESSPLHHHGGGGGSVLASSGSVHAHEVRSLDVAWHHHRHHPRHAAAGGAAPPLPLLLSGSSDGTVALCALQPAAAGGGGGGGGGVPWLTELARVRHADKVLAVRWAPADPLLPRGAAGSSAGPAATTRWFASSSADRHVCAWSVAVD